jgi:hypothetical protein
LPGYELLVYPAGDPTTVTNRPLTGDDEEYHFEDEWSDWLNSLDESAFELSAEGRSRCYDAAVRLMLEIPQEEIARELQYPEHDVRLLRVIYIYELDPEDPGLLKFDSVVLNKARRSYLTARGTSLWSEAYGQITPREQRMLEQTVDAIVGDKEPGFLEMISPLSNEEVEEFEVKLTRLLLRGQRRIMNELKANAGERLKQLIKLHEDVLKQQEIYLDKFYLTTEVGADERIS